MRLHGVAVVGSANLDEVLFVERFAEPGETVLGDRLEQTPGGKGLNQAVAAARIGPCAFVGCLGDDEPGQVLAARLRAAGVDLTHTSLVAEPTGRAVIQVAPDGENSIVVMPLANSLLTAEQVTDALDALRPAVVLTQLEIPLESVQAAADWATLRGARFILNPSPVRELPGPLLAACDPVVLNLAEARMLRGEPSADGSDADVDVSDEARRMLGLTGSAVVTAGAGGAAVAAPLGELSHVPGVAVEPVDTTGAGDEFAGTMAGALASGEGLVEATRRANEAAARAVATPRHRR